MLSEAFAQIKNLSTILADPVRAERVMHSRLISYLKVCKKVITRDLLSVLYKYKIGTNDVNKCVKTLCRNNRNYKRRGKLIQYLMKDKLDDAEKEMRRAKIENLNNIKEYKKVIREEATDRSFNAIMRREGEIAWNAGKQKKQKKIEHLVTRRTEERRKVSNRRGTNPEEIEGITYKDAGLEKFRDAVSEETYISKPKIYGGVEISNEARDILSKDPGFMLYEKIDSLDVEVEIEKGMAKTRYELMSREDNDKSNDHDRNTNENGAREDGRNIVYESKVLDYTNLRATDIPTVPRLHEPKQGTIKQEIVMENTKQKLLNTLDQYVKTHCKNGELKANNLTSDEKQNLNEIKKEIKDKKIVVFTTDKSGKFSVDSPENYELAVRKHTEKDEEVEDEDIVRRIENKVNQHMRQFNKMFQVGKSHEQEGRVVAATISSNTPAPPMYGLRKDHKTAQDEREGPPVRPVCGASEAPNSRLSHFLSLVINDYCNVAKIDTECRSSEEMKAAFEKFNGGEEDAREGSKIISMDVKALYPSMEWDEIGRAVRELIENSEKDVEGVDWHELGKYLAVNMTAGEIAEENLQHVIPKRKEGSNRKITVAYLCNKQNEDKWLPARIPGYRQKKKMIGIAVASGVRVCMENHVYRVGDRVFLQKSGGPIGLELTGAVSRAFMRRWDRLYLERAKQAGIEVKVYERYVDDSNQIAIAPPKGAKYNRESRKVVIEEEATEETREDDERLASVLRDIANSIMPCIQMEADWPSKNRDGKLPILDLKVWTNKDNKVMYTHYEKPMATKSVLHSKSAHPEACKRSVHTQEILRRLMNCSRELKWEDEAAPVATEYMYRMKLAGYKEGYRKSVLLGALNIYKGKLEADKQGVRPIFRPKDWKREVRDREKANRRRNWATKRGHTAPIFVPATPGGGLAKAMREVAGREASEGIHFNIVEKCGVRIKSQLQKSNPTATPGCSKENCLGCREGKGEGGKCHKNNVNYEIECKLCPEEERSVYIGETARNLYTRALEHENNKEDEGFMNRHMRECHEGEERHFIAKVTHTNQDCLSRQTREGVLIRRSSRNLLNSKSEWFQPPLFRVQSEVVRE